ncbi:hypothetical protein [Thermus caliditerrae]|uniref:hypothetical protein n=1 Tax=Thermus caliditerrae TaxID=1330700 RepID=UPI00068FB625|nr:hypothetical protein [Thermus caliditerrae]
MRRYNLLGPEALRDGRHSNPGAWPKLTPEETLRALRPVHRKAKREAQGAFKKNSAKRWRRPGQRGEG